MTPGELRCLPGGAGGLSNLEQLPGPYTWSAHSSPHSDLVTMDHPHSRWYARATRDVAMADIVIAEFMDKTAVADLSNDFEVLYDPTLVDDGERLAEELQVAQALVVRNRTRVDQALLATAPELRVVARLGVGLDNIDLDACKQRGIEVAPATGANAVAVAEYVIGALLVLIRGVYGRTHEVISGDWPRPTSSGGELMGKRLGLLGYGLIAREVAARATAFGMEVAAHDPYLPPDAQAWGDTVRLDLDQLFASSQAISVHVPLTEETRSIVDAGKITSMPEGAVLVNTSRGAVVDETALLDALRDGHLGGAALDVFAREPVDAETGKGFRNVPNLLLTPHIAGVTRESDVRIGQMAARSIRQVLAEEG